MKELSLDPSKQLHYRHC